METQATAHAATHGHCLPPARLSRAVRLACAAALCSPALVLTHTAQAESDAQDADLSLETMVISAERIATPASQATRSITVLTRERIEQQATINADIGDVLAQEVPGFATSTEGLSNFTQTLRGRSYLTMIDGVPISTPLMESARDLKSIDASALDRVEVLRGGTAAYGFGATGGLVHYITRDPRGEAIRGFSKAGFSFSTEHPSDSIAWHTAHGASGQAGALDFLVNGSFTQRDGFYDADGDRIPSDPLGGQGGLADTDEYNLLGKLGHDFDAGRQRVELLLNHYNIEQDTDFVTQPGDPTTGQKAIAVPGTPIGNQTRTENTVASLTYEHNHLWGSTGSLQAYRVDYSATFPIVAFPTGLPAPDDTDNAGSVNEFDKTGARLTINTPLGQAASDRRLTWGLDYLKEQSSEEVVGDNAVFGTPSIPELDQTSVAAFAQLTLPISDIGRIRTGVRHERIDLDVPTFTGPGGLFGPGGTVAGGSLSYDATLFNLTGVYYLSEATELFGGYSQGYSVSDVRSVLRQNAFSGSAASDDEIVASAEALNPEAQEVDNYEIGLRGDWLDVRGAVIAFYSESDLGLNFGSFARVTRQPEEIWGIETSVEADLNPHWTLGGTATWLDSRTDLDGDGSLDEELPNRRLPPIKLTGFVGYQSDRGWSNRLQFLYSGTRSPDGATNFAGVQDEVDDAYLILDYFLQLPLGPGQLQFGINNLLNEDYFPVAAQSFGLPGAYSKGLGRSVSISYGIEW